MNNKNIQIKIDNRTRDLQIGYIDIFDITISPTVGMNNTVIYLERDRHAMVYIVVVLMFYSLGIVFAIIMYLKHENEELLEERPYADYVAMRAGDPDRLIRHHRLQTIKEQLRIIELRNLEKITEGERKRRTLKRKGSLFKFRGNHLFRTKEHNRDKISRACSTDEPRTYEKRSTYRQLSHEHIKFQTTERKLKQTPTCSTALEDTYEHLSDRHSQSDLNYGPATSHGETMV